MRIFSLVAGLVLLAQPVMALNLAEMQEFAVGNRQVIKRFLTDLEKSEKDLGIARSAYYPSVDLSYELNTIDQESFIEEKVNDNYTGAVSWNVFNGFKDKYRIGSAELLRQVEAHQYDGIRQDIQLNVALRYLDVYERRANLVVAEKSFKTLGKIYRDGQNRLDVGLIDRNELLKFKVDLDDSELQVEAAKGGLRKAILLLGREVGKDVTLGDLAFSEFESIPPQENLEHNMKSMFEERSEILALQKLQESSEMVIETERSEYYPKVDLVGSYRNFGDSSINTLGSSDADDYELRAQLNVSVNLFRGFHTSESVAKAELERRGLQYDLDELRDTLSTELKNLHIDLEVSLRNVRVALTSIEQAEENLRITEIKYEEGLQRESELLDAVTSLSRARFNHVRVVREVFLNYFRIIRAVEGFTAENS